MERFFNNRWTISFADGTLGFLTETLGFMPSRNLSNPDYPSKLGEIRGMDIWLETVELFQITKVAGIRQGQFGEQFYRGRMLVADSNGIANITELGDLTERRIEVVEYSKDAFEVYDVHYTSLAALQIDNPAFYQTRTGNAYLREVSFRHQHPQSLYTQYCTCPSCGALLPLPQNDRAGA